MPEIKKVPQDTAHAVEAQEATAEWLGAGETTPVYVFTGEDPSTVDPKVWTAGELTLDGRRTFTHAHDKPGQKARGASNDFVAFDPTPAPNTPPPAPTPARAELPAALTTPVK